jgi:hypothetical protein
MNRSELHHSLRLLIASRLSPLASAPKETAPAFAGAVRTSIRLVLYGTMSFTVALREPAPFDSVVMRDASMP